MLNKDIINEFKAARWKSSDEMRAFIKTVESVTSEDVVALLDIVMGARDKDSGGHTMRVRAFAEIASRKSDKALFEPYLKALKSDDRHLRSVMVNLFPHANNPPSLPKLCELLRSSDVNLRRITSQILQKIGDGNTIKLLSEMFVQRGFSGRTEAIDIASASIRYYSVEFFKVVLSYGTPPEKVRVLKYLSLPDFIKSHKKSIAATAKNAFSDSDDSVLMEAMSLFSKVCTEEEYFDYVGGFLYHSDLRFVKAAIEGLRHFSSGRVAAALERKMHTGPNEIRMVVLETIESIGTSDIQQPLIKALQSRHASVQDQAFKVLRRLTDSGKLDMSSAVLWLLRSNDAGVRSKSVAMVAAMPGKKDELWKEILGRLRHETYWVRQQLIDPLTEMAGAELTSHVLQYLSDADDIMCHFALDLLARLNLPESLNALVALVKSDGEWWVREKAISVMANMKDAGTVLMLIDLATKEPDFRVPVIDALINIGTGAGAAQMPSFLTDENPDVRFAALRFLDKFGKPDQATGILPLVQDKDIRVRQLAGTILDRWKIDYTSRVMEEKKSVPLLDRLLMALHKAGGDDLILIPENPPYMKKHGEITPITATVLPLARLQAMIQPVLNPGQLQDLKNLIDVDFSYEIRTENLRFRSNIFASHTGISAVFRTIKGDVFKLEELGLPSVIGSFGDFKNGLVLVGGPTGSGKSTTLASIISNIISTSRRNVISIEDPIEVVHKPMMGIISQREVGVHTPTFNHALKMTLREDPDVILVGEMRDLATIQFAITASETGHLVFGTVHTVSADSSVDRLINAYPPEAQEQIRSTLADSLRAVLCQYLLRRKDQPGRVLASELMINNSAVSNLIRKGKTFQIPSVIATGKEQHMQSMDTSLMELLKKGMISAEEAYLKARDKTDFEEAAGITKSGPVAPGQAGASKNGAAAAGQQAGTVKNDIAKDKPKWPA